MGQDIIKFIDHTLLKAEATENRVVQLCDEAREFGFAAVCVHPVFISLAASLLGDTAVKVASVLGFPLGADLPSVKYYAAEEAFRAGADEIDMVLNIGALKDKKNSLVQWEIEQIVELARAQSEPKIIKVIIETALLTEEEKKRACEIILLAGADFVKTSTGFAAHGAQVADIKLFRSIIGDGLQIKASGGIKTLASALALVEAGANRIGTSSGVQIAKSHGAKII